MSKDFRAKLSDYSKGFSTDVDRFANLAGEERAVQTRNAAQAQSDYSEAEEQQLDQSARRDVQALLQRQNALKGGAQNAETELNGQFTQAEQRAGAEWNAIDQ